MALLLHKIQVNKHLNNFDSNKT